MSSAGFIATTEKRILLNFLTVLVLPVLGSLKNAGN
jgi:hypothetical protein